MYVRSLELANFRNFRRVALDLRDGPVLVVGENGQGKTNLLEATELLATAKSSRAGSDRELVNWKALTEGEAPLGEPFARVRATTVRDNRELRSEILIRDLGTETEGRATTVSKTFRLNGVSKRALEFVGALNVVTFSPLDVSLVDGSPSIRRRYLDVMNAQVSPKYLYALQRYQKVLFQRNHLLRQVRSRGVNDASLSGWSDQLLTEGALLICERAATVARLTPFADRWYRELAGIDARLEVSYRPALGSAADVVEGVTDADAGTVARVREAFGLELDRARSREAAAGLSLVGPHRDDLRFLLAGVDLNVYGSRGQQRLGALALKLAEADHVETRAGSRPVLLMDDVLSELDPKRQAAVTRFVAAGGQTLLTTTSLGFITADLLDCAQVLHVEDGVVTE